MAPGKIQLLSKELHDINTCAVLFCVCECLLYFVFMSVLPGIFYGREGDITVWAKVQCTVLWLDANPKELDVLGGVCPDKRVFLHTGSKVTTTA